MSKEGREPIRRELARVTAGSIVAVKRDPDGRRHPYISPDLEPQSTESVIDRSKTGRGIRINWELGAGDLAMPDEAKRLVIERAKARVNPGSVVAERTSQKNVESPAESPYDGTGD